jgi:nitrate reductase assembly molybdenum cofactor insertion protein NarJ
VSLSNEYGAAAENEELRNTLADTRTNLAVLRSEMAQLRTEYEEKCHEFNWFV